MAPDSKQTSASEELQYASGGLKRETGWWGAFVIGLAGTILVTGIAPVDGDPARRFWRFRSQSSSPLRAGCSA